MNGAITVIKHIRRLLPDAMLRDQRSILEKLKRIEKARTPDRPELDRLRECAEQSVQCAERRKNARPSIHYPPDLPISEKKDHILETIRHHSVVILCGETGSGKTTQLPKICLEAGLGVKGSIACTQPRRVAALSVSRRIAEELAVPWGSFVGCKIRFSDVTSPETCVKMMTDGMLLAEIQGDPELLVYDAIIIDEAHERSLNIDFLLGYMRLLRRRRPDLKLIITSATIDTEMFSQAFDQAPVIEVSGRVYPVDIQHIPFEMTEESAYTYIDAALDALDTLIAEENEGDILVFMPSEKDIHETTRRLTGRHYPRTEVLPLFGRLTASDQQRVFAPQKNRRVVVATNIAETSITIPNIRFVVDTGLARISRYNPRNHTRRLPIEPISQSSARQRAGRCGRVRDGVCVRLYSEKELLSRPVYTQPEIQRADLAEVILRLLSLRLGDVHTFPFIEPPRRPAIQGGFDLLQALGAVDDGNRLTERGRAMARLPIAPSVARMALQARQEGALRETLIIAAGISIQDPRVRPAERQDAADREHRKFWHPESDFMALINIWNAYHDTVEHLGTQGAMRKFCSDHFLSYNRMREWRDIHEQIRRALREVEGLTPGKDHAPYDAIHRSIASGLLGNIAEKKENNLYRAARGRDVMVFPGSGLFVRTEPRRARQEKGQKGVKEKTPQPEWIVAAEIVETSRVYARTAARINVGWLPEIGKHLCRASHSDPRWQASAGRVVATETLTLYGLIIDRRAVSYGPINPEEATEIFIRQALVNEDLRQSWPFLEHNRVMRQKAEIRLLQRRNSAWVDLDEAAVRFYMDRLKHISSIHDLNRALKEQTPSWLFMNLSDLIPDQDAPLDPAQFPDHLSLEGEALPLTYAFRPGEKEDGVTVTLPFKMLHFVPRETLEWLVPGLLAQKVEALLRALPGRLRKQLVPVPETARWLASELKPTHPTLIASLTSLIEKTRGLRIEPSDWSDAPTPDYLRMRVQVIDQHGKPVMESRDLDALLDQSKQQSVPMESDVWRREEEQWAHYDLRTWSCGDLPERVEVSQAGALPVYAYPGLRVEDDMVHVYLFRNPEEAETETRRGIIRLGETALAEEMAWLQRDLRNLRALIDLALHAGGAERLQSMAYEHIRNALFLREKIHPLTAERFEQEIAQARELLGRFPSWFMKQIKGINEALGAAKKCPYPYPDMKRDLDRILPADFLLKTPADRLPHLTRYIRGLLIRAERARLDPVKDRIKEKKIHPFQRVCDELAQRDMKDRASFERLRWLLEEYRVSVFAQELGTAETVSPARLQSCLDDLKV